MKQFLLTTSISLLFGYAVGGFIYLLDGPLWAAFGFGVTIPMILIVGKLLMDRLANHNL